MGVVKSMFYIILVIKKYYNCVYFQFTDIYGGILVPNDWAYTAIEAVVHTDMTFAKSWW